MTWKASNPQLWMSNCAIQAWTADGRIHFNQRGADHQWGAYSCDVNGRDTRTWSKAAGHRGLGDVTPDGKYALLTVERAGHPGVIGSPLAEPGRGAFCDLWLTDGLTSWPLTGSYSSLGERGLPGSGMAVIWPCISPSGRNICWAQSYHVFTAKEIFGYWRIMLAALVWKDGRPQLDGVTALEPETGRFYETYGWTDDGRILFASDMGMPGWWNSQIFTMNVNAEDVHQVSAGLVRKGYGDTTQYAEFAKPLPDGSIAYCTGVGANWNGMDHWVRPADGGPPYKLTDLSHGKQPARLATSFVISPDAKHLLATYSYDSQGSRLDAYMFDLTN